MKRCFKESSVLDERELLEMYRAEHAGLWAAYVLLFGAILVQLALGAPAAQVAGEAAVLLALCAAMLVAYARSGIWDAHSRPSTRGNAAYAAVCAVGVGLVVAGLRSSVSAGLFAGVAMFALCFLLLTLMMAFVRRRQRLAEAALECESGDEIDS